MPSPRLPPLFDELLTAASAELAGLPARYRDGARDFAAADPLVVMPELWKHAEPGRRFLEWGSGVGTLTLLADLAGYMAFGIERDPELAAVAGRLAARFGRAARFATGDYRPNAGRTTVEDAYSRLGAEIGDFDVVYVFPWPHEIDLHRDLFARHAGVGARLLVYSQTMDMLECVKSTAGCSPLRSA